MTTDDLIETFSRSERSRQLLFLAHFIHWVTIIARDSYSKTSVCERLQFTNEWTHRLVGHLRDLLDDNEALDSWRLTGIKEVAGQISPKMLARIGKVLQVDDRKS